MRKPFACSIVLGIAVFLGFLVCGQANCQPAPPKEELVVRALVFANDNSSLYYSTFSSKSRMVRVNLSDGSDNILVRGDGPNYSALTCVRESRVIAGGYPDGIVHLIDPKASKVSPLMEDGGGQTLGVTVSADLLLIRNADIVYLYELRTQSLTRSISFQQTGSLANGYTKHAKVHHEWPEPVHLLVDAGISPDGQLVAVTLGKNGVAIFPADDPKKAKRLKTDIPYTSSLAFSPDGKTLAVSGSDPPKVGETKAGIIELFDLTTGTGKRLPVKDLGWTGLMRFSADGKRLVFFDFSAETRRVRVWDVIQNREIKSVEFKVKELRAVAVSPDGKLFAIGGDFGYEVWSLESGKCILRSRQSD